LFRPGLINNDIFYLFIKFLMAQMELIRGPSRYRTNSNKIWI
jgi:hypothetical protein